MTQRLPSATRSVAWSLAVVLAVAGAAGGVEVEFLGEVCMPTGTLFDGTEVGGLSGLGYDAEADRYVAVSDDRSIIGPARFYTLTIDLSDGRLTEGGVRIVGVTTLRDRDGSPFARGQLDPEGIALAGDGTLFICSEGDSASGVAPFVRRFSAAGTHIEAFELPAHYGSGDRADWGVRSNLGFEGLDVAPGLGTLFVACENALVQDGPAADLDVATLVRILELDPVTRQPLREYAYEVAPVPEPPQPEGAFRTNGVSAILAVDGRLLIVVERSFSAGRGNTVRLYSASLESATNVLQWPSLEGRDGAELQVAGKELLFDLGDFGIAPDNIEAITFGPTLADGRRSLILVSDNNFKSKVQTTQFLAFAVDGLAAEPRPPLTVAQIQGRGHRSPHVDQWVDGIRGVVTALHEGSHGSRTLWLQDTGDGDPATSDALRVAVGRQLPILAPGDLVAVSGRVEESEFRGELSVTRLAAATVELLERKVALPPPVRLGRGGRAVPSGAIDDDGLVSFDPAHDAIDFFESLEGMRVEAPDAVVVGPNSQHGVITVLADGGSGSGPRSARGALVATSGDSNPERLLIDDRLAGKPPALRVGDRFSGPLVGVLDYAFGAFRIYTTEPLPPVVAAGLEPATTSLGDEPGRLRLATFNLENLSFLSRDLHFERLAGAVVDGLASPHLIAVQEVQDDSGRSNDGVVSAERTLARLAAAISAAGGPAYEWLQVDPVDGADGGAPGANIRVAILFDPQRVQHVGRGSCGEAALQEDGSLSCSPARLAPRDPAFSQLPEMGHYGTRKPLVAEFEYGGERLLVVNNHLNSKIGDDQPFGARQPPELRTEKQRLAQARVVAEFLRRMLSRDQHARVIVLGDFNDFEHRPPLLALRRAGLVNLIEGLPPAERYTYIYQGNAQAIDHVLVSPSLAAGAEVDIVHLNTEFPTGERSSDHDPVVVRFPPW